jgi:hypothetical protein
MTSSITPEAQEEGESEPERMDVEQDPEHEPIQREPVEKMEAVDPRVPGRMAELAEWL